MGNKGLMKREEYPYTNGKETCKENTNKTVFRLDASKDAFLKYGNFYKTKWAWYTKMHRNRT